MKALNEWKPLLDELDLQHKSPLPTSTTSSPSRKSLVQDILRGLIDSSMTHLSALDECEADDPAVPKHTVVLVESLWCLLEWFMSHPSLLQTQTVRLSFFLSLVLFLPFSLSFFLSFLASLVSLVSLSRVYGLSLFVFCIFLPLCASRSLSLTHSSSLL